MQDVLVQVLAAAVTILTAVFGWLKIRDAQRLSYLETADKTYRDKITDLEKKLAEQDRKIGDLEMRRQECMEQVSRLERSRTELLWEIKELHEQVTRIATGRRKGGAL